MKKIYYAPKISIVDVNAENVMNIALSGNADHKYNGGNGGNNDAKAYSLDWDDEEFDNYDDQDNQLTAL